MSQFDEPSYWPKGREKWNAFVLYKIALYFAVLFMLLASFPNRIWDPHYKTFIYAIGLIAIWRVSWWALMVVRASYSAGCFSQTAGSGAKGLEPGLAAQAYPFHDDNLS